MESKKEKYPAFGAKQMIEKHSVDKTVIKYGERKSVEILVDTKHYRKGQVINPHSIVADQLIDRKIAKAVK